MNFGASQRCINLNISCHNKIIQEVTTIKFLGLHIHKKINWEEHIEYVTPKPR
jgi:hypothetical protein